MSASERTYKLYRDANGNYRLRIDAPGIAAISAKFDPAELIRDIAELTGLEVRLGDDPRVG